MRIIEIVGSALFRMGIGQSMRRIIGCGGISAGSRGRLGSIGQGYVSTSVNGSCSDFGIDARRDPLPLRVLNWRRWVI
jgi:hypothetical protein